MVSVLLESALIVSVIPFSPSYKALLFVDSVEKLFCLSTHISCFDSDFYRDCLEGSL